MCTACKYIACIPSAVQVDMRSDTLLEIGTYPAPHRRLHQTERASMMFGKPGEQLLPAAYEIFDCFQRCDVVQSSVRCAVVASDRVLDQFLEFVQRHEQAQISLRIRQRTTQITWMRAGVSGQSGRQPAGDGAKKPLNIGPFVRTVLRPRIDTATDKFAHGRQRLVCKVSLCVVELHPFPRHVPELGQTQRRKSVVSVKSQTGNREGP